jgi:hypothetical protein
MRLTDSDEAFGYWNHDTEEKDDNDEVEAKTVLNGQESEEDVEAQVQVIFSEQNKETRREAKRREEKRSEAMIARQSLTSKTQIVVALSVSADIISAAPSLVIG